MNTSNNKNLKNLFRGILALVTIMVWTGLSTRSFAQPKPATTSITVTCNVDCSVFIDDIDKGFAKANKPRKIIVIPGSKYVRVVSVQDDTKDAGEIVVVKKGENKARKYTIDGVEAGNDDDNNNQATTTKQKGKIAGEYDNKFDFSYKQDFKEYGRFDCLTDEERRIMLLDGRYVQQNLADRSLNCVPDFYEIDPNQDWSCEITYRYVEGATDQPIGLVFISGSKDKVKFSATADGTMRLSQYLDGSWNSILEPTKNEYINKNKGRNTLRCERRGGDLLMFINGNYITSVKIGEAFGTRFGLNVEGLQTVGFEGFILKGFRK
ncbi:MAG: hypothetical protein SGJ04_06090 [Bacteroidota bacterium]|nr:hypothetical protein [Bacteroidota bacterium]